MRMYCCEVNINGRVNRVLFSCADEALDWLGQYDLALVHFRFYPIIINKEEWSEAK